MAKAVEEVPVIKRTLAQLIGGLVQRIVEDPKSANACIQDLYMWHDGQDAEDRQAMIRENKKVIERAQQAANLLFQQYVTHTAREA